MSVAEPQGMRTFPSSLALVLSLLACAGPPEPEDVTRDLGSDHFTFGSRVELTQAAKGNIIAAGEEVGILAPVAADTLVAGGTLDLRGPFGADVYAAGGRVDLDGHVAGSVRAAGGSVQLGPNTDVRGGISIAAGEAAVRGTLHDYLQIAAGTTLLDANVAGDVEVSGGSLEVGPAATIQGALTFQGPQPPQISPGARVIGEVRHIAPAPAPAWQGRGPSLIWALGLALLGALGFAFLPKLSRAVVQIASDETRSALLVGACLLFGVPVAALLALFTILGAPLALVALALYALCLPLGYVVSGMALSERLWRRWGPAGEPRTAHRFLTLSLVLVLLAALCSVPVLGWGVTVLLLSAGMGSLALHAWRWYRRKHPRQPDQPAALPPGGLPAEQAGARARARQRGAGNGCVRARPECSACGAFPGSRAPWQVVSPQALVCILLVR
jgi:hypothetical protein